MTNYASPACGESFNNFLSSFNCLSSSDTFSTCSNISSNKPLTLFSLSLITSSIIIGISSLAGGHKTLIPTLIKKLNSVNRENIVVIAGGVIPEKDYDYLKNKGVKKIFGPGTIVSQAAIDILNILLNRWKQKNT